MIRTLAAALTASTCIVALATPAAAQTREYNIPAGSLKSALDAYVRQSGRQVVYRADQVRSARSPGTRGQQSAEAALAAILSGSGFTTRVDGNLVAIVREGNAQSVPAKSSSSSGDGEEDNAGYGDIIVTAQKREERSLTVPAPVTALAASELARHGDVRLQDFFDKVPGLNIVSQRQGETQIILRGITTGNSNNSTVAVYIDEAPIGSSTSYAIGGLTSPDLDPAGLQRIEVLRGPQGTLYGASSLGGLVKYVTIPPSTTNFSGQVQISGSSVDGGGQGYGVRAIVNGPLVPDTLGLVLNVYKRRDPGFIDNVLLGTKNVNSAEVWGGRAALLWKPTELLTLEASAVIQNADVKGTAVATVGAGFVPLVQPWAQSRRFSEPTGSKDRLYTGVITYDLGFAEFKSITSYQTVNHTRQADSTASLGALVGTLTGASNVGVRFAGNIDQTKFTQEARFTSTAGGPLEWQGGFFYTREKTEFLTLVTTFSTVTGQRTALGADSSSGQNGRYREVAAYGDVTYHLTSQLQLQGGFRYASNKQEFAGPSAGLLTGTSNPTGMSKDNAFTYLLSAKYQFDPNQMVFARVASGYRPGGVNSLLAPQIAAGVPRSYDADTLTNYEVGYKASLFDRRATVEVSLFDIEWKDIQIRQIINGFGTTGNGSGARSRGVEFEATLKPVRSLTLSGNAAYTDAKLTKDAPALIGFKGDRLPKVPRFSASVSGEYEFPIGDRSAAYVGATYSYRGNQLANFVSRLPPAGVSRAVIPSYGTFDLRVGIDHGPLSAEAFVKNVGNTRGYTDILALGANGYSAPFDVGVIQPRTFGLSLTYKI